MRKRLLSLALALVMCLGLLSGWPAAGATMSNGENLALHAKILGDSGWNFDNEEVEKAFDGDCHLTKWCTKVLPWVVFQIKRPANVRRMIVYHAGSGTNETVKNNTPSFTLQILDTRKLTDDAFFKMSAEQQQGVMSSDANWKDVLYANGNQKDRTHHAVDMVGECTIFRFKVNHVPNMDQTTRLYEIELYDTYNQDTSDPASINSARITDFVLPTVGGTPVFDVTIPEGAGYHKPTQQELQNNGYRDSADSRNGVYWLQDHDYMKPDDVFTAESVCSRIILVADPGYIFDGRPSVTINGSGEIVDELNSYAPDDCRTLRVWTNALPVIDPSQPDLPPDPTESVPITPDNFPDDVFRNYVNGMDLDHNGTLSPAEIKQVTSIVLQQENVEDMTGIEHFPFVTAIYLNMSKIKKLDVSHNPMLEDLKCSSNDLTELTLGANQSLTNLECSDNELETIDLRQLPNLKWVFCERNLLTSLDLSQNANLEKVYCQGNQLMTLDVSHNPKLWGMSGSRNHLCCLDISQNPQLRDSSTFYCDGNVRTVPEGAAWAEAMPGFSLDKVDQASVTGGEFTADGTVHYTGDKITYTYDCGQGRTAVFTLVPFAEETTIPIDEAHFPDPVFRQYVMEKTDTNQNGMLSEHERRNVQSISFVGRGTAEQPSNMKGIEYFTSMRFLSCQNNYLEELDLSGLTRLEAVDCSNNRLKSLDLKTNSSLGSLTCDNNLLLSLDVRNNANLDTLEARDCGRTVEDGAVLTKLDPNFDPSKVSGVTGGSIQNGVVHFTDPVLTYQYGCGRNQVMTVRLTRKNGGTLSVSGDQLLVTSLAPSTLVIAAYDEQGRMLSVRTDAIPGETDKKSFAFDSRTMTAFLLDSNHLPLCPAVGRN